MLYQNKGLKTTPRTKKWFRAVTKYSRFGLTKEERKESQETVYYQKTSYQNEDSYVAVFPQMCQPFIFWNGEAIDIGGIVEYNKETQTGFFSHETVDGLLEIADVHSYQVFGEVYPGKILPFNYTHLPEPAALGNIFVAATICREDRFYLKIYHNTALIFEMENVYPLTFVDHSDLGAYKNRIPYVRFASSEKEYGYDNYMYCFRDCRLYQLDRSKEVPSFLIDYTDYRIRWDRFDKEILPGGLAINIYMHLSNSKTSQIVSRYIKNADKVEVVRNIFSDDTTVNLKVTYINRQAEIRFLYYCASIEPTIMGVAVMGIPISELEKGTLNYRYECRYMADPEGIDIAYYKLLNSELYALCKETPRINSLPQRIVNSAINSHDMITYLYQFLRNRCDEKYAVDYINARPTGSREYEFTHEKEIYENIFQEIVSSGNYSTRWKNEFTLYQLVKASYPDAIYQYHSSWLRRQSLDIYIPCLNLGIEYQGEQHYAPVLYFGGDEALAKRKELDARKRQLCADNNVNLLEWRHDEPINTTILKIKLKGI